jgi:hypothetical protein
MVVSCKLIVSRAYRGHELVDLVGVLDALGHLDAGTDIDCQRLTARADLQNAIGHVCRREPTT